VSDEPLAVIAFVSAALAVSGLALRDRHTESPSLWYQLTWPRQLDGEDAVAFFRHLAADRRRHVVALEAVACNGTLSYRLGLAESQADSVLASLRSYLPGVAVDLIEHDRASSNRGLAGNDETRAALAACR
jgi:hypothetical protein